MKKYLSLIFALGLLISLCTFGASLASSADLSESAQGYLDALGCPPMTAAENKANLHIISITKDDTDYIISWDYDSKISGNGANAFSKMHFFDPADLSTHYQPFTVEGNQLNYTFKKGDIIGFKTFRIDFHPESQLVYLYFEGILESAGAPAEIQTPPLFFTLVLDDEPYVLEEAPRVAGDAFTSYLP